VTVEESLGVTGVFRSIWLADLPNMSNENIFARADRMEHNCLARALVQNLKG